MAFPKQDVGLIAIIALLFSSLSLDQISQPNNEILTECVCWCLILLGGKIYLRLTRVESRPFNASKLNIIAFSVTLLFLASSLQQTSITPLVSAALSISALPA